ncbi:MAG: HAMP domain-containing histidine kinase [Erysipelotrichaceae bacterium]|nr:HAMP domain-containing histidine kinase [Erysipelotrichaceae bacterium]
MRKRPFNVNLRLLFTIISVIEITVALIFFTFLINILEISPKSIFFLFPLVISGVVGGGISLYVNQMILRPVERLSSAMKRVSEGNFNIQLDNNSKVKEVRDIYGSFNIMAKELSKIETLQSSFISNVSHEIKTPINAISGYATLLQDGESTEEERMQYIDKILFNSEKLCELTNNILLLSKLENQGIQKISQPFDLDEQIREAIMMLESKWTAKEIEFDIDLEDLTYVGNESLLLHVWNNLISNAIKFTPYGSMIKIKLYRQAEHIYFVIEDEGAGINEEDMPYIFNKFYQADTSRKQEGNGLGLALVKHIVELYHGKIEVCNLEYGCRFTVML